MNKNPHQKIIPADELINEYLPLIKGKNIGLVVNNSSRINSTHLVDTLISLGVRVQKIFAPEHGFRGAEEAGSLIKDGKDEKSGVQIISIYGKKFKPDVSDLNNLDLIVYDIQDVGVRFFTYISTLHYVMESCAENKIPILILDRPNPNGHYVDGPILDTAYRSFIGIDPIPIVYGLTSGELAQMIKGECWINECEQLSLTIIKCKNYSHADKVELAVNPSPNLPNQRAVLLYPSLCLFEGTVVSLGRGTSFPFQVYGHPKMKSKNGFQFKPLSVAAALNPPLKDSICNGVDLREISMNLLHEEKKIQLNYLISAFKELNNEPVFFNKNLFFDKLAGTDQLRNQILQNKSIKEIRDSWKAGLNKFKRKSKRYQLYN